MASAPSIRFFYSNTRFSFRNRKRLKSVIHRLFKKEGKKLNSLNYIFCTDRELLKMNQEYLAHDYYTDVITFDLSSTKAQVEAEVYISIDRIRDNAHTLKISFRQELLRVIFHGALHLCGYTDKSPRKKAEMSIKESQYLHYFLKASR